jgi:hypothetical protein
LKFIFNPDKFLNPNNIIFKASNILEFVVKKINVSYVKLRLTKLSPSNLPKPYIHIAVLVLDKILDRESATKLKRKKMIKDHLVLILFDI